MEPNLLLEDITPKQDKGVLKTLVKKGEGEETPGDGCKVYVHYVGHLMDGETFDSSRDRGDVFTFITGQGTVIKGWDIGVLTMTKNEICELKISPEYAYGEQGFPQKIPENSTLIFEIELLEWDDMEVTSDGGVKKHLLKAGEDVSKPNLDAFVKVHLRGSYEGRLFDERDVEFVIGEGYKHNIIEGVEKTICKMKKHEKARAAIKAPYAFKDQGNETFNIPPNASEIEYEICLFRFDKAKEIYEMDYEERIKKAESLKVIALTFFKDGEFFKAIDYYDRILKFVRINKQDSDYVLALPYNIAAHSNMALCYLKSNDYQNAVSHCHKVIKLDEKNVKARFRLAHGLLGLKEYDDAMEAFKSVLTIEPNNAAAKRGINETKALLKKQVDKEKRLYVNMFGQS